MALQHEGIDVVRRALKEDIGDGDVTTLYTIAPGQKGRAVLVARAGGIIAGLEVFETVFKLLDEQMQCRFLKQDGDEVKAEEEIAVLEGEMRAILSGERTALNFVQRMSGIATHTRQMVNAVAKTGARILDTRKTAPGLRFFDKWAVRIGGGENHRQGLYDMFLIKENHITASGGITAAVQRVRSCDNKELAIEVEVKNLQELQEAIDCKVDRILLDNMDLSTMKKAVEMCQKRIPLEASGNVTLENVAAVAHTGVDYISVGALTHSVKALDISLLVQ